MRHAPSITETQALLQAIRNVGGYPTMRIAGAGRGAGNRCMRTRKPGRQSVKAAKARPGRRKMSAAARWKLSAAAKARWKKAKAAGKTRL